MPIVGDSFIWLDARDDAHGGGHPGPVPLGEANCCRCLARIQIATYHGVVQACSTSCLLRYGALMNRLEGRGEVPCSVPGCGRRVGDCPHPPGYWAALTSGRAA